jgi:hypothetical protein
VGGGGDLPGGAPPAALTSPVPISPRTRLMPRLVRSPAALYAGFALGFLLFRAALFAVTTAGEYALYRDYGDAARRTSVAELFRTRDVEYPQLAVGLGMAAGALADVLPDWTAGLTAWRPNPTRGPDFARFEVALGLVLFAVDVGCLALVYATARRVYPEETPARRVGRLAVYALATGAIGLILYDRQDLVVGAFALLAVFALARGWPAAGYAALTTGAAYKLVPALLLPVWVFAAAAARAGPGAAPGRFAKAVVREGLLAAAVFAVWPVLAYLFGGGDRAFAYLGFHSARGLQIEAAAAWPVFLLDPAAEVEHSFGGFNANSGLADRVARGCSAAVLLGVAAAVVIAARGFGRVAAGGLAVTPMLLIPHVVASALLVWLAFILANKVCSPQYLLWLGPLVPLLPLRTAREWVWLGLLLVVMGLTTLIFPCFYDDVHGPSVRDDPPAWAGPTPLGLGLLAARSAALAVATVWLAVTLWRSPGGPLVTSSPRTPRGRG